MAGENIEMTDKLARAEDMIDIAYQAIGALSEGAQASDGEWARLMDLLVGEWQEVPIEVLHNFLPWPRPEASSGSGT